MLRIDRLPLPSALVALALLTPPATSQTQLWRQAGELTVPAAAPEDGPQLLRRTLLDGVDGAALLEAAGPRIVDVELPDGRMLSVELEPRSTPRPGVGILHAEWAAGAASLTLAVHGDAVSGTLREDGALYRLQPIGGGRTVLEQVDESTFQGCATHAHARGQQQHTGTPATGAGAAPATPIAGDQIAATQGLETIDVLVAYTDSVKSSSGGANGIAALIDLAVFETNLCFQNGGAQCALRLVHTHEVSYSETGNMGLDLDRVEGKNDGYMDEVHGLRTQYGADAVALLVDSGSYCGIANLMTSVSGSFKGKAFSVTKRSCATGYYTFGHELGHNFGCSHDQQNAGASSKPYGYGYRTPNNQYRTVMAYSPGTRVPVFSSPDATWNGKVMGTVSDEDNARTLTENAPTIAGWTAATTPIVDCNLNGTDDGVEIALGLVADVDQDGLPDDCASLIPDVQSVPIVYGGTQNLTLDAGPEYAGQLFLLLGSLSGTDPATPVGSVALPLVVDAYTNLLLNSPGAAPLSPVVGLLDDQGRASAQLVVPPGQFPVSILLTPANHAFVSFDAAGNTVFASNPAELVFSLL